jgi:DNA replication protein DnaC
VSLRVPVTDSRFGKAITCPTCGGGELMATRRQAQSLKMAALLRESGLTETARHDRLTWQHFTQEALSFEVWQPKALAIELAQMWSRGERLSYDAFGADHPFAKEYPTLAAFVPSNSLWLYGLAGSGKTGLARRAYRDRLVESGKPGIFVEWQSLYEAVKSQYGKKGDENQSYPLIEAVATIPVLVLDDVGQQRRDRPVRDDEYNKLWTIVDRRYRLGLETIITSNLDRTAMRDQFDDKLAGRLVEMAVMCEMAGRSFREFDQGV